MNTGPLQKTEANAVAALHARAPYLVWCAYRVSFDGVKDDTFRAFATPISSVSPQADKTPRSPMVPPTTFLFYSISYFYSSQQIIWEKTQQHINLGFDSKLTAQPLQCQCN